MERIRFLAPNLISKTKFFCLLFIALTSSLLAKNFEVYTAENISFEINKVSVLALKIKNISSQEQLVVPDFIASPAFSIISPLQALHFAKEEEKNLYYVFLVENTQQLQSLTLPFILRDEDYNTVFKDYLKINIKPYTSFKAWIDKSQLPIFDDKTEVLKLILENDSNIPCIGDISFLNGIEKQGKQFYLQAGEYDTLSVGLDSFLKFESFFNAAIDIDYSFIYSDSVVTNNLSINEFLPYYSLYQPDLQSFYKIPAYLSNKVVYDSYGDDKWEHSLRFWAYGHIQREKHDKTFVSWYFKKDNGRFLNHWTDSDEYMINFYNDRIESTVGRENYSTINLLGSHYGNGVEVNYYPKSLAFSYQLVKDYYREQSTLSTYSLSLLKDKADYFNEQNKIISFYFQSKRRDFNANSLIGKDTNLPEDNDKIATNISLNLSPNLQFQNELLWFRNNSTNDEFDFAQPMIYNQIRYAVPSTAIEFKHYLQTEKIDGEYDYKKSFESNLSHNNHDLLSFVAGFRYSNEKSDYKWAYPYEQTYQQHFLKPKLKIYKSLYALGDYSMYRYNSRSGSSSIKDKQLLMGIALDYNFLYFEALAGEHNYNYSYKDNNESVLRLSARYLYYDKFSLTANSKTTKLDDNVNQNQHIILETSISKKVKASVSLQNYHYQGNAWRNMIVSDGSLQFKPHYRHHFTLSGKHYELMQKGMQSHYTVSLEYTMLFNMPVIPKKYMSDMRLEFVDSYKNQALDNLLIKSGNMYALTNEHGVAEFLNIAKGNYPIEVVNLDAKQMIFPQLPDTVQVGDKEKAVKKYSLAKHSKITVQVNLHKKTNKDNGNYIVYSDSQEPDRKSDISFVLQNKDVKIIKKTDKHGVLYYDQLFAGNWQIYPLQQSLPHNYEFEKDIQSIEVLEDSSYQMEFDLRPKAIIFQSFIDGGEVKIKE